MADAAAPFDRGQGRPLREWVVVSDEIEPDWLALARESLEFVRGATPPRRGRDSARAAGPPPPLRPPGSARARGRRRPCAGFGGRLSTVCADVWLGSRATRRVRFDSDG